MGVVRPDVYMLMTSGEGWLPSPDYSRVVETGGRKKLKVARGSLAQVFDTTRNLSTSISVEVRILDDVDMKMVPLISDLKLVAEQDDQTYNLLRGIQDPEKRYELVKNGRLAELIRVRVGDKIMYHDTHGSGSTVPGVVRFIGSGPQAQPGWVLGIQIKEPSWMFGHTNGAFQGKQYFDHPCQEEKGIFCDISEVEVTSCDNHTMLDILEQDRQQYSKQSYAPETQRESWSKQLEDLSNSLHNSNNSINNSSGQKCSMNNNIHNGARNKPSNSFMGKLALFREKENIAKYSNNLLEEIERDLPPKAPIRRKHSFSSSERPTSRSSSNGTHSRPGSRVQGNIIQDIEQDLNKNSHSSDSFSWNPNASSRKKESFSKPRKSPSPKFHSSASTTNTSSSNSGGSHNYPPRRQHNSGDANGYRSGSKLSDNNLEQRKISSQSGGSSSSDRKYQPAVYEAGQRNTPPNYDAMDRYTPTSYGGGGRHTPTSYGGGGRYSPTLYGGGGRQFPTLYGGGDPTSGGRHTPTSYGVGGRSTPTSTETDSTLGFGRSWDEISKVTGYSVVEYKNGTAGYPREKTSSSEVDGGMPKNKSYSEIIKNMIARDDNLTIGELSNRNEKRLSQNKIHDDTSEISLDFQHTQADSDELSLPFGRSLSRQSGSTLPTQSLLPAQDHHNDFRLWQPNSGTILDQDQDLDDWEHSYKSQRSSTNVHPVNTRLGSEQPTSLRSRNPPNTRSSFHQTAVLDSHHHINQENPPSLRSSSLHHSSGDLIGDYNHAHGVRKERSTGGSGFNHPDLIDINFTNQRRSEDRSHSLISPDFSRSSSRPPVVGGGCARSRQTGQRTAPFHRTGSAFGRKTPVPVFDTDNFEDGGKSTEEEEEGGVREGQGGDGDSRTWGEVLKDKSSPRGVDSLKQKENRLEDEAPAVAKFDQIVPDWLEEEIGQELAPGSMVQLEQAGQPVFGVVRWRGSMVGDNLDLVGISSKSGNQSGHLVGVELEDEIPGGGNGTLKGRSYFNCGDGKGVFIPVTHVRPDPRFTESLVSAGPADSPSGTSSKGQEFGSLDCPVEPGVYPPYPAVENVHDISGRNKGIQGHQNSCYLDATLFSMFTFSSVFDSLLYRPRNKDDIPQYEEVQRVLRDEIVNPLRKRLFVRADRVLTLRRLLDSLSSVSGLMDQEKDPEEFLNSLLNQVLKASPYLELTSGQTSHTYQLFVEKDPSIKIPTVQELFEQSFLTSSIKFNKVPPILILQMPRFGTQFKMYERIVPTLMLDITDVIDGMARQCVSCGQLATIECLQCYGDREQGLQSTAFCSNCYPRLHHNHQTRGNHHATRIKEPVGRKKDEKLTRVHMHLVAVICIETSHYVSFVRCGDNIDSPWAFFDSMADRKGEQNGYNIPEISPVPEVDYILSDQGSKQLRNNPNLALTEHARRLVADSYICIYQSEEVRMYN